MKTPLRHLDCRNASLESITDAVFISDSEGNFIDFNEAFARFLKFRNKTECLKTLTENPAILDVFMPNGESSPPDMRSMLQSLRGELIRNAEYTLRRKDTGQTWIASYSFGPIRDENGSILGSVAVGRDITERKQMEEEIRELERKNQDLQEFAFIASHDLSEPLRVIQTFGSRLSATASKNLGQREKDYISRMTAAANRMQELLDALLRYSRIDKQGGDFGPVKMDDLIEDVTSDLEIATKEIGACVTINPLPLVKGDPSQLRQVFQNLIANAIKYRRSGVNTIVRIYGDEEDGMCRIFVEDNGVGFDEKYLDKIFQPFHRLHGKNEYPGTGIGLAICKKIVERHGGTITAKSAPENGSTFIVELPKGG